MLVTRERPTSDAVDTTMASTGPALRLITHAVAENLRRVRSGGPVMAVVKADGYGHGAVAVATAAARAGAEWLGVTDIAEAVPLRAAGLQLPVLAWLHPAGIDVALAVEQRVDVAVGSVDQLAEVIQCGSGVRVHLQFDTGMARGGCPVARWSELIDLARRGQDAGRIQVVGAMGHLPGAAQADPAANAVWVAHLRHARDAMIRAGLTRPLTHLAATAAALTDPQTRFDLVRVGAGLVGIDPSGTIELTVAGEFTAPIVHTAEVAAHTAIGYDGAHTTDRRTRLAVIGVGYADGVPRELSPRAEVAIEGRRHRIVGRVSMDQIVVDIGDTAYPRGTTATLFGPGDTAPSVQDWAAWANTIPHTIVTGIGPRVRRTLS